MRNRIIKIGSKLSLTFNEPGKEPAEYYCKILDLSEKNIYVDYPVDKATKKTTFFPLGVTFSATIVGNDEAVYQFNTKIESRMKRKIPTLVLTKPQPAEIRRVQRRQFVRVDTAVDVAVHRQTRPEGFPTITSDISGGGLSVIVPKNEELEMNETIELWLVLAFQSGKYHYIETTGQVVFIKEENGVRTAAVKFLSLKAQEQQLIVSFCFEKQREFRKKELS